MSSNTRGPHDISCCEYKIHSLPSSCKQINYSFKEFTNALHEIRKLFFYFSHNSWRIVSSRSLLVPDNIIAQSELTLISHEEALIFDKSLISCQFILKVISLTEVNSSSRLAKYIILSILDFR